MSELRRAVELRGRNNKILGTSEYFKEINRKNIVGYIKYGGEGFNYVEIIKMANIFVTQHSKEILEDCKKYAHYFPYVSNNDRIKLINFLKGLYKFSQFAGSSCSICNSLISYLELKEAKAKKNSNFSDSEIDKGVAMIYNGRKTNLCSSERVLIVKKAVSNGVSWTVGNDAEKMLFITEVMQGHGADYLKDVNNKYNYVYVFRKNLKGKCGIEIFSDGYIKYYEEKIFGTALKSKYIYGSSYDYVEFYKRKLNEIVDEINSDFDRGARGTHFVKYQNQMNIKKAAENLEKLGLQSKYIVINIKRFALEDVTDKLMNVLREAKRDGEMLRRKYPNAVKSEGDLMKFGINSSKIALGINRSHLNSTVNNSVELLDYYYKAVRDTYNLLIVDFVNLVKSNALYDIKRRFSWSQDLQYIFDGRIIEYDDTGNIAYGVIAKAAGISEFVGHAGAGLYNFWEAVDLIGFIIKTIKVPLGANKDYQKDIEKLLEALSRESKWISTFLDDPRDYAAIELGYEYYNKL